LIVSVWWMDAETWSQLARVGILPTRADSSTGRVCGAKLESKPIIGIAARPDRRAHRCDLRTVAGGVSVQLEYTKEDIGGE
jgi:hypothetical protein